MSRYVPQGMTALTVHATVYATGMPQGVTALTVHATVYATGMPQGVTALTVRATVYATVYATGPSFHRHATGNDSPDSVFPQGLVPYIPTNPS